MAQLPDLVQFGMKWEAPPPHVVPDLSMIDKLRVLVQHAGNWSKLREGIKPGTAKNVAKQLRDGTYSSIARLRPIPDGMFDAVAGEDPDVIRPEIEGENWSVWVVYHTDEHHERWLEAMLRRAAGRELENPNG